MKVFVSSTSEDLKGEYRQAARNAAIAAGLLPVMQEDFAASGQPPVDVCLRKVAETDVLVVIVAHRYGWVPPEEVGGEGKSITWLECVRAIADGHEVLAFLVEESAQWPAERRESYRVSRALEKGDFTPELAAEVQRNIKKLGEFKAWLNTRVRATFSTPEELQRKVGDALREWVARRSGVEPRPAAGDPRAYLQYLREDKGWIDIRGLQVGTGKAGRFRVEELYIALQTAGGGKEAGSEVPLEQALQEAKLVITGDPGSGKSTFLRRVASTLCRSLLGERGRRWLPGWQVVG